MKKIARRKDPLGVGDYNEIVKSYHKESDRGAAILAGAFLDLYLKGFLKEHLTHDAVVDDLFEKPFAPLSTFSARARCAYAMRLIGKKMLRDLDIIREIRNYFAHHPLEDSFENPDVKRLCWELSTTPSSEAWTDFTRNAKGQYLLAVGMYIGKMHNALMGRRRQAAGQG